MLNLKNHSNISLALAQILHLKIKKSTISTRFSTPLCGRID